MVRFALRAVAPKLSLNVEEHAADLRKRVKRVQEQTRRDYQKTTRTWDRKPRFTITSERGPAVIGVTAGTTSEIYQFVDEGTKPHVIRARKAKVLRFFSNYKAKTQPNVIGSSSGGSWGILLFAKEVHHPGNKARNFTLIISEKARARLIKETNEAVALLRKRIKSK